MRTVKPGIKPIKLLGKDHYIPTPVFCVKFQRQLPGLDEPPFHNELGQRIYEQVSRDAWALWMEHCKMIQNEYETAPIYPSRRRWGEYYP